jgi:hypothetical protein
MQFFTHIVNHPLSCFSPAYHHHRQQHHYHPLPRRCRQKQQQNKNNNNNNIILRWVSELSSLKFSIQCKTPGTALGFGLLLISDRFFFH